MKSISEQRINEIVDEYVSSLYDDDYEEILDSKKINIKTNRYYFLTEPINIRTYKIMKTKFANLRRNK